MLAEPAVHGRRSLVWFAVAVIGVTASCASDDSRVTTYPVSGQVLYKGEPAIGADVLFFFASADLRGQPIPTPQAVVDEEGHFRLGCYKNDDGAPAGEYRVAIVWEEALPSGVRAEDQEPQDRLQGRYGNPLRSGLAATVVEGKNTLSPFELE